MRLKFIASFTHSRMRVNFTPCWVLVGNKADLADRERMISIEEGKTLARDLGCHIFREISVKESMSDATQVFEDLWRHFFRLSPRSPSSSQRRKFSLRIQDKISILDSACSCASDALKNFSMNSNNSSTNEILVTTITSTLKRQINNGPLSNYNYRNAKQYLAKNERCTPRIPENIIEDEEDDVTKIPSPPLRYQRSRRNALVNDTQLTENNEISSPPISIGNNSSKSIKSGIPENVLSHLTPSSRSSSNASLSSQNGLTSTLTSTGSKSEEIEGFRSQSDTASFKKKDGKPSDKSQFDFYPNHSRRDRTRSQKSNKSKYSSFPHNNSSSRLTSSGGPISIHVS